MTNEVTERRCKCGHLEADHTDGGAKCRRCPSSGVWVDSLADWAYPCEQFEAR
ncbi:MAG: hypothetical protein R3C39_09690 [Dehalococcoidia bacterium]